MLQLPYQLRLAADVSSIDTGLADGWVALGEVEGALERAIACRPSDAVVFNLMLEELGVGPLTLGDLLYAEGTGELAAGREELGALVGLLTQLPGETLAASQKTATLRDGFPVPSGATYPRVQIVLEGLCSTTLKCLVGLRIHVLTIDPKLDLSLLWMLSLEANQRRRAHESGLSRPPPPCTNPKNAKRRVYSMQQLARCWAFAFKDDTPTARGLLQEHVKQCPCPVTQTGLRDVLDADCPVGHRNLHYLSPEVLCGLSPEALRARTHPELCAEQLLVASYRRRGGKYVAPKPGMTFVFAGSRDVLDAPLPPPLVGLIKAGHKKLDCDHQHFRAYTAGAGPAPAKRPRVHASPAGASGASGSSGSAG